MPGPGAAQLLEAWERALDQEPARRALTLLVAARPQEDPGELAAWPLGRRNAALFQFRTDLFGPELSAIAQCPSCGAEVELSFPVTVLDQVGLAETAAGEAGQAGGAQCLTVRRDGFEVTLRAVTSSDLLAFGAAEPEPAELEPRDTGATAVEDMLVRRCITGALDGGVPVAPASLPATLVESLRDELAQADPAASTELSLECPECGHAWLAPFHIASYLWSEVHHWARRMLLDIHTLAHSYGWSERDILALPPRRRQAYLELVEP